MKKYTVYLQNKRSYNQYGWQSAKRKQSDEELKKIVEQYSAYTHAVYKVKDNDTGKFVMTNAE